MLQLLLLLLPVAAVCGWITGYRHRKSIEHEKNISGVPSDYFIGLNYLINEQPDKAVDIFIKMLEVNTDTVETHLALGNLFRRRGEVDRAIRIHQNLIARPQLSQKQRMQAVYELAKDYLHAGVFDRAERLFTELLETGGDPRVSLDNLINIYQQQRDWQQAISTAKKLEKLTGFKMSNAISHYYCELAEQDVVGGDMKAALVRLREALAHDSDCARANIILSKIYFGMEDYERAIKAALAVDKQDEEYASEVIDILSKSHIKTERQDEFATYLQERIATRPRIYHILAMADYLRINQDDKVAMEYLPKQMPRCLSLRGLQRMLELYVNHADVGMKAQLSLLKEFTDKLLVNKPVYRCVCCGFSGKNLYWQCPSCRRWNSVKPIHGLEGD